MQLQNQACRQSRRLRHGRSRDGEAVEARSIGSGRQPARRRKEATRQAEESQADLGDADQQGKADHCQ